jgi:hypothetical protein
VVVDDHKHGDFSPYILKSENRGRSWRSISGNLPERHVLWRVVQDHEKPGLMFLASEFGLFFTVNGGGAWTKLKGGLPNISFRDLAIQKRENDLVGASFGRSIYVLDDYTPLRQVTSDMLASGNVLFPVRKAPWYVPKRNLGCGSPGCQPGRQLFRGAQSGLRRNIHVLPRRRLQEQQGRAARSREKTRGRQRRCRRR